MEGETLVYCWACGRKVEKEEAEVFYTEGGRRAYVHPRRTTFGMVDPGEEARSIGMGKIFGPIGFTSECYLKAKQDNTLFLENPREAKAAEAHKGMLY